MKKVFAIFVAMLLIASFAVVGCKKLKSKLLQNLPKWKLPLLLIRLHLHLHPHLRLHLHPKLHLHPLQQNNCCMIKPQEKIIRRSLL